MSPSWEKALPWTCQVSSIWHGAVERTLVLPRNYLCHLESASTLRYRTSGLNVSKGLLTFVVLREGLGQLEES